MLGTLFFDKQDRELLRMINETIDHGPSQDLEHKVFDANLHPHGILELTTTHEYRMAHAVINLLGNLEAGGAPDRLMALRIPVSYTHLYGMASFFNKKLENCLPHKDADASLVLPGTVLVFDHLYNRLCQISLGEHRDVNGARTRECGAALPFIGEDAVTATPGREGYMDAVNKIKQMLRQGEAIQVVPSCRFSTPFEGDAFTLYRRMRRCNASPYMFFMDLPGITLFGSSPEVMVRCDEGKLQLSRCV